MATWHGYFAVENINLNTTQRQTLIAELRALGPASDPQPARLNHWRTRTDNEAAIFEALFNENALTIQTFKDRLGVIFGVDPSTIGHTVNQVTFDTLPTPVVVFSRSGTNYLRFAAFGGVGATWPDSGDECRAYIKANQGEWES